MMMGCTRDLAQLGSRESFMPISCEECSLCPRLADGWVGNCTGGFVITRRAGKLVVVTPDFDVNCQHFIDFRPTRFEKILYDGYPL